MKNWLLRATILAAFLSPQIVQALFLPASHSRNSEPAGIIVKFRPDSKPKIQETHMKGVASEDVAFDELVIRYRVQNVEDLARNGSQDPGPLSGVHRLIVPRGEVNSEMLQAFQSLPNVEYAEYDWPLTLFELPSDSLFKYQWPLANSGQEYYHVNRIPGPYNDVMVMEHGTTDADIDADDVLAHPPDHTETAIVAIIDTGVDLDHPDLEGRIWRNAREIPGNGFDDDHNGYTDDVNGWDFSGNEEYVPIYSDPDPNDTFGHGTHCAGIVAAAEGNSIGIVGITPNCRIMALKFWPMLLMSMAAEAIVYAADNGADVISMSFGGPFESLVLKNALEYAHSKGVVLVAASGNSSSEAIFYPAGYADVIVVGATDSHDHVTAYSTFGELVDLCAPGNSVLSLRADSTDMYSSEEGKEPNVHIVQDLYYEASGTSMACPHVAGVVAYLRSLSPGLTPAASASILYQTAEDLVDPCSNGSSYPGWDKYSGFGRVNLRRALDNAPRVTARIISPAPHAIETGLIDIRGTASGNFAPGFSLEYGLGSQPQEWHTFRQEVGGVEEGLLGSLPTDTINGLVTIRLRVGDTNSDQVTFFAANRALAEIASPREGDTLFGPALLSVSAYCPDFRIAIIDYADSATPDKWTIIDTLSQPAIVEIRSNFECSGLPNGLYRLRLRVFSHSDLTAGDTIAVRIASLFSPPYGWRVDLVDAPAMMPNYGDFDRDGVNEIILGTEHGIKFFALDGTEKTAGMPTFPALDFRVPIPVGNIDGDGFDDFVAVSVDPAELYGFCSNGREIRVPIPQAPELSCYNFGYDSSYPLLSLRDLDNDSLDEIIFDVGLVDERKTQIVDLYDAGGIPRVQRKEFSGNCIPADLDGDGLDEIYCNGTKQYDLSGSLKASIPLGSQGVVLGMTAADVDGDSTAELVVAIDTDQNEVSRLLELQVLEYDLSSTKGYPLQTKINAFWEPAIPVFGDLDEDGIPEMLISFYTDTYAFVHAFRLNGRPYLGDSTGTGAFAVTPWPSIMKRTLLVNLQGGAETEVLAYMSRDVMGVGKKTGIVCWDKEGNVAPGWPLQLRDWRYIPIDFVVSPVIGDLDRDGRLDMFFSTTDNELLFANFSSQPFDSAHSPRPMWRGNRRLNNPCLLWGKAKSPEDPNGNGNLPTAFTLSQNYPNPFNLQTRVDFSLPATAVVIVSVFNMLGQEVATLWQGTLRAGRHQVYWDGRDKTGREVASGIYLLRLNTAVNSQTRKMVLLK